MKVVYLCYKILFHEVRARSLCFHYKLFPRLRYVKYSKRIVLCGIINCNVKQVIYYELRNSETKHDILM